MSTNEAFEISLGLTVLPPRSGPAYLIPCDEWQSLKTKISKISQEPWLFQNLGFLLIGSSLSTVLAITLGTFSGPAQATGKLMAWAVVAVTGLSGSLSLLFAHKERQLHQDRASEISAQMEIIETRFDIPKA